MTPGGGIAIVGISCRSPVAAAEPGAGFDAVALGLADPGPLERDDVETPALLATSWEAFEGTGQSAGEDASIGVFVAASRARCAGRVARAFALRGPLVDLHGGETEALLAVHLACQSLTELECDAALAGAVAPGGGAGILLLRRLADAVAGGDHVHGVIRGSAVGGDSLAATVAEAVHVAGVDGASIGHVEVGGGEPAAAAAELAAIADALAPHAPAFSVDGPQRGAGATAIDSFARALAVLRDTSPNVGPRHAAVSRSSDGANAHVVVERAPAAPDAAVRGAARVDDLVELVHRSAPPNGSRPAVEEGAIAIVGMAGRFPHAPSVDALWRSLLGGEELIEFLEGDGAGAEGWVRAASVLDDIELFDARLFGYTPREADYLDPQTRVFLECAWEALESAGHGNDEARGDVGLFAGGSSSGYLLNIYTSPTALAEASGLQVAIGTDRDSLATSVAYRLNLTGPAATVQSFCSTSLVAVHLARKSLLAGECGMALAGGVSINLHLRDGYAYEPDGIYSPDGHCRAFDAAAAGTIFGDGAAVVVLKRLADALADGDTIHAVVKGSAMNNDGAMKAGFTAPSVERQAEVIARAHGDAGVAADTIGYVEAHGTGTQIGDPIEVAALTRAFRRTTGRSGYCGLGSIKTNVGHLDRAAGVTSLIKAALALRERRIPPTLHFTEPNAAIDFPRTPFRVIAKPTDWPSNGKPRRAGVTALGIGGTNVHVVMEEAPAPGTQPAPRRPWQLLPLSGRTEQAVGDAAGRLAAHLQEAPEQELADVAYTLQVGRKPLSHRRFAVARDAAEAAAALARPGPSRRATGERSVVFMLPGQGAQHPGMGRDLYVSEPLFRAHVDRCCELLEDELGRDLRRLLYPHGGNGNGAPGELTRTELAQPALFVTEYALARLWMDWGLVPAALIGHSIGEYVAACLAGVLGLEDALRVVARRGRLMQEMDAGRMLSVPLGEDEVAPLLRDGLSLAAVNGPSLCVLSGPHEPIVRARDDLRESGVEASLLETSHAFHSALVEPMLDPFAAVVRSAELHPPQIDCISNVTGRVLDAADAQDPAYWTRQARATVRFADGIRTLLDAGPRILLEVGPGTALRTLARGQLGDGDEHVAVSSLGRAGGDSNDVASVLRAAGEAWSAGADLDWERLHGGERRRRVPLPTYPFQRRRHWIEGRDLSAAGSLARRDDVSDWFHLPTWQRVAPPPRADDAPARWLVLGGGGVATELAERLRAGGAEVQLADPDPSDGEALAGLIAQVAGAGDDPVGVVVSGWGTATGLVEGDAFPALLGLVQQLQRTLGERPVRLTVVTGPLHDVIGTEAIEAGSATALGICRVAPKEHARLTCRCVDLGTDGSLDALLGELHGAPDHPVVAYRAGGRWTEALVPHRVGAPDPADAGLRRRGCYLVTGGSGGIGLELARHLASAVQARIVLMSRRGLGDDERTAECLREMHEAGAEVVGVAGDVCDPAAVEAAVALARERFGGIDGAIHAAGVPGGGVIGAKTRDAAAAVMAPKVTGTLNLVRALEGEAPDFVLLCSSAASYTGDFGQVDYCAANSFMDAFALAHERATGVHTVSVNWAQWREVGMAVNVDVPEQMRALRADTLRDAIAPSDGRDAFARVVASGLARVFVSTQDASALVRAAGEFTAQRVAADMSEPGAAAPARESRDAFDLTTRFAATESDVHVQIRDSWEGVLGVEGIGIDDNFFELGGDSLIAVQLVALLGERLGKPLTTVTLFEGPTIRQLAALVEEGPADDTALADRRERGRRAALARAARSAR